MSEFARNMRITNMKTSLENANQAIAKEIAKKREKDPTLPQDIKRSLETPLKILKNSTSGEMLQLVVKRENPVNSEESIIFQMGQDYEKLMDKITNVITNYVDLGVQGSAVLYFASELKLQN